MTREALTPAEREAVQAHFLRRWLAAKVLKGTRRRTDRVGPVKRYDTQGRRVA